MKKTIQLKDLPTNPIGDYFNYYSCCGLFIFGVPFFGIISVISIVIYSIINAAE